MADKALVSRSNLRNIANAIRTKNGTTSKYTPANMASAITAIPGGAYNWMGEGVECIDNNLYDATVGLADTTYSTWTASTTAKSLKATQSLSTFPATDMENNAYLIRWVVTTDVAHNDDATLVTLPVKQVNIFDQQIIRRPSSLVNIQADNFNANVYVNTATLAWMQYYNASGVLTYTWASSYGFYGSVPTPTFSSSTVASPNVTPKTPILYARCSTTYFSTDRYDDIDIENTSWHIHGSLYRMDADCCMRQRYGQLVDVINDVLE